WVSGLKRNDCPDNAGIGVRFAPAHAFMQYRDTAHDVLLKRPIGRFIFHRPHPPIFSFHSSTADRNHRSGEPAVLSPLVDRGFAADVEHS
ncbi:hypothetical protein ACQKPX_19395, partial [Photobacterium sp. DNB23_23_1]